jgi:hypothetical protein
MLQFRHAHLEFYIQVTKGTSLERFVKRIVELIENKKAANDSELEVLPHQQSLSMHSSGLIKGMERECPRRSG